ncbi:MAG TPA: hypothetical protein PL048_24990 [Leptospiraceae bacterium]|nr:hypothetical protein [Leptospiraceae bacterium]
MKRRDAEGLVGSFSSAFTVCITSAAVLFAAFCPTILLSRKFSIDSSVSVFSLSNIISL